MGSRPRYVVRSVKVAAGSFLTAAAVSVVGVLGAAPAQAAGPDVIAAHAPLAAAGAGTLVRREGGAADQPPGPARSAGHGAVRERLGRIAGIRTEMQQAVSLGLVSREQADRFTRQLAGRIMRGL